MTNSRTGLMLEKSKDKNPTPVVSRVINVGMPTSFDHRGEIFSSAVPLPCSSQYFEKNFAAQVDPAIHTMVGSMVVITAIDLPDSCIIASVQIIATSTRRPGP